jgi:hypothetical protein
MYIGVRRLSQLLVVNIDSVGAQAQFFPGQPSLPNLGVAAPQNIFELMLPSLD